MKTGKSLSELAAELERQNAAKKDYLADTSALRMEAYDNGVTLRMNGSTISPLDIGRIAHRQIATYTGIPAKYYDRMQEEAPELLARNVNTWFGKNEGDKRMIRTLDGTARAFLSNRYRCLDNYEVATTILPIIAEMARSEQAKIESCELTESRMYLKVVTPRITAEVVPGDVVQAGFIVSNSETGQGSVTVSPLIYRLVCSNGMILPDGRLRKYHVGRDNEAAEDFTIYRSATMEASDRAFLMKMEDTVRAAANQTIFDGAVAKMREARDAKIEAKTAPQVVELVTKEYGFSQEEGRGILGHLIDGGELSLYGLANAVTRQAQDVESYDRSTDMEAAGYSILTINPALWRRINSEAAK